MSDDEHEYVQVKYVNYHTFKNTL